MTSVLEFVGSVNKIAIIAFIAVLGFLVYEAKRMIDDKKRHEKPTVPTLELVAAQKQPVQNFTPLPKVEKKEHSYGGLIAIGVVAFLILIGVAVYFITSQIRAKKSTPVAPIVTEISSAGLRIYSLDWKEYTDLKTKRPMPGEKVYIGIQTIQEADIDRARIKVNERDWQISDITTSFNPDLKVYYKEYEIATGTAMLKIAAQLHSASDGWLGD